MPYSDSRLVTLGENVEDILRKPFIVPNNAYKSGRVATNILNNNVGIDFIRWLSGQDNLLLQSGNSAPKIADATSAPQVLENLGSVLNLLDNLAGDSGDLQTCALGDVMGNFLMFKSTPSEEERGLILKEFKNLVTNDLSLSSKLPLSLTGDSGSLRAYALGRMVKNSLTSEGMPSKEEQEAMVEKLTDLIMGNTHLSANFSPNSVKDSVKKVSTARSDANKRKNLSNADKVEEVSDAEAADSDGSDAVVDELTSFLNDSERVKNSSPEELMTALAITLLIILQKQRELQGENRWKVKAIASNMVKATFAFKMKAAKETRKSARIQAIGQMASGIISVVAGLSSMAASAYSAYKFNKTTTTAGGKVDQIAKNNADKWNTIAQVINQMGRGLGELATGVAGYIAAGHTYQANVAETNAMVAQSVMQSQNELASNNQSNIRDTKQHMDALISFLQQLYRIAYDTLISMKSNI